MKILFIGDIVGSPGRRAVKEILPNLQHRHRLDVVIANGENSAGGNGITPDIATELFGYGVHAITTGDHLWDQREVLELLQNEPRFLRPLNYPSGTPGRGSSVLKIRDLPPIAVMNAQGRSFMQPPLENPFVLALDEAKWLRQHTNIIFVDFHAEATSEKIAFARLLDGQVSAVVGTHTHVQTADEQIFPGGTAYLTDAGFTGPHESVLGREIQPVLQRFRTAMPQRFEVARNDIRLHGAIIEIDNVTGKALKIIRVAEPI
ncbi:MAG TPA: TIGR00282 family metallophosphoesterase [Verrucomicrobiae bacterium]